MTGTSTMRQLALIVEPEKRTSVGSGRRPADGRRRVPHAQRAAMTKAEPLHITIRIVDGMPSLRQMAEYGAVTTAFSEGCDRFGFRLIHYAVLKDHIHPTFRRSEL